MPSVLLLIFSIALSQKGFIRYNDFEGQPIDVTSDERSFLLNGKRALFLSGSFHYSRATPGMWPYIFDQMVEDGLNMVETYVFWNLHEFKRGQPYNFEGMANISSFLELAGEKNLFVNLRFGPYVCAEWNYGGLPVWLNNILGMKPRTHDSHWESEMERFVKDMVKVVEPHLARNGGPIILAQIENEYHGKDPEYLSWCGDLAKSLNIGIPWIMCNGESAPGTINACNGNDCAEYAYKHDTAYPGQPLLWTENEGWYQGWAGQTISTHTEDRTPQDMAYVILRWFARGGCHHNYYMWYGGSNFGSWMGASVAQMYADGVNLHSDGLPNEPKRSHLKRLHQVLAMFSTILLSCPIQAHNPEKLHILNGTTAESKFTDEPPPIGFEYYDKETDKRVVFLENSADRGYLILYSPIQAFYLPPMSVIVVDSGAEIAYNSSDVHGGSFTRCYYPTNVLNNAQWHSWVDTWNIADPVKSDHPLEQLSVTQDESDYLFYSTSLRGISSQHLLVQMNVFDAGVFMFFIDSVFSGEVDNRSHSHYFDNTTLKTTIDTKAEPSVNLTILSVSLGIPNNGLTGYLAQKGIISYPKFMPGTVKSGEWYHKAKLHGEELKVFDPSKTSSVSWSNEVPTSKTLTWYKAEFKTPPTMKGKSLLLDMKSMTRGHIYINGFDLGRYWLVKADGHFVQQYYFIPPDLLKNGDINLLVILDENGGGIPEDITLVYSSVQSKPC